MTFAEEIRAAIDHEAAPITLAELRHRPIAEVDVVVSTPPARGRSRLAVAALGVAASIGLLVGGLSVIEGDRAVLTTGAGGAVQIDTESVRWERADVGGTFAPSDLVESTTNPDGTTDTGYSDISMIDVFAADDGLVAVGREAAGFATSPVVWSAGPDAEQWIPVGVDGDDAPDGAFGRPEASTLADGRLVIVGTAGDAERLRPVAWSGRAGDDLVATALPTGGLNAPVITARAVAATATGLVALGSDNADPGDGSDNRVLGWWSPEGRTWERLDPAGFEPGDGVSLLVADGERLVAVGSTDGFGRPVPAAWTSTDGGRSWVATAPPPVDAEHPLGSVIDLVVRDGRWFALGRVSRSNNITMSGNGSGVGRLGDEQRLVVWSSVDGDQWTVVAEIGEGPELLLDGRLAAADGGMLIAATRVDAEKVGGALWWLANGSGDARPVRYPDTSYVPSVVTATGSGYVLFAEPSMMAKREFIDAGEAIPGPEVWRSAAD